MTNSADPDQLASSEAKWSGSIYIVCKHRAYLGSAGLGLNTNPGIQSIAMLAKQNWIDYIENDHCKKKMQRLYRNLTITHTINQLCKDRQLQWKYFWPLAHTSNQFCKGRQLQLNAITSLCKVVCANGQECFQCTKSFAIYCLPSKIRLFL